MKKINSTMSNYLVEVQKIIENESNTFKAQKEMEENWIEIAKRSLSPDSELWKKQSNIFKVAHNFLLKYHSKGNLKRKFKWLGDFLIDERYILMSFTYILVNFNKTSLTDIAMKIGGAVIYDIWNTLFKNEFKDVEEFSFGKGISDSVRLNIGMLFINIYTSEAINEIFERKHVFKDGKEETVKLIINPKYEDNLKENAIIYPQSLPMIHKPIEWGENKWGGLILNEENKKGLVSGSSQHLHSLTLNNDIYNAVNKINSQSFIINKDLVEYIESEGSFLMENEKENNHKNFFNINLALDIAKTFINSTFYLPTSIDWRGRIYVQSFYLTYQGTDLSNALIYLSKGKSLTEEGLFYLYIYGANIYNDNKISKSSLEERYQWVIDNLSKIYSMEKSFMLNAESPFLFAAFCLVLRILKKDPKAIINLPIFLDATCSGIQHFAAMLLDSSLAKEVNLLNSEKVNDIYESMVPHLNEIINNSGKENIALRKLSLVKLTRNEIKKIIMTKTYNITTFGIIEQLKSSMNQEIVKDVSKSGKEYKRILYEVPSSTASGFITLNNFEVTEMGRILSNNIFTKYPSLHSVFLFLTSLTRAMIKLGIPIKWATPAGLNITQHYVSSKTKQISINFLGKNRKAVLKEWIKDSTDSRKQIQAIIPNIIHSFDASHLLSIIKNFDDNKYILPIHDCFGTHPNDMIELGSLVRSEFINLYNNKDFLKKLFEILINNLIDFRIPFHFDEEGNLIIDHCEKIIVNRPPIEGDLNLEEIMNSKYIIT